jgi:hypothetical protein
VRAGGTGTPPDAPDDAAAPVQAGT